MEKKTLNLDKYFNSINLKTITKIILEPDSIIALWF